MAQAVLYYENLIIMPRSAWEAAQEAVKPKTPQVTVVGERKLAKIIPFPQVKEQCPE